MIVVITTKTFQNKLMLSITFFFSIHYMKIVEKIKFKKIPGYSMIVVHNTIFILISEIPDFLSKLYNSMFYGHPVTTMS